MPAGTTLSAYAGGRGLSQTDAPNGTFLACATAPGNVALDGLDSATNSLYTENLLREMKVPGVRLKSGLKRVRLNVRLKSNGKQVPWESTSLEDDFTFFPIATELRSKVSTNVPGMRCATNGMQRAPQAPGGLTRIPPEVPEQRLFGVGPEPTGKSACHL